jgi:hypothetical protein
VHITFKELPLKQLLIPPREIPLGFICPEKSPLAISLFSFLFFQLKKKQKIEHQTELYPVMFWTLNLWKAYLHLDGLNPIPVSICLEKSCPLFLPANHFEICLSKYVNSTG